jgi:hypothetical protein
MEYNKANTTQVQEYKRNILFDRYVSQYKQGSKTIETNILMGIKRELLDIGIINKLDTKVTTVKSIIKSLIKRGRTEYQPYLHYAHKITNILNGVPIREFTEEQYNEIMKRHAAIERIYLGLKGSKHQHQDIKRVNFPNAVFIVRQICLINGWDHMIRYFPVPKVEGGRKAQEKEWKVFISYLKANDKAHRWAFI